MRTRCLTLFAVALVIQFCGSCAHHDGVGFAVPPAATKVTAIPVFKDMATFAGGTIAPAWVALSPDGAILAYADQISAKFWSTKTGKPYEPLQRLAGCGPVVFSPNGRFIVLGDLDNQERPALYEVRTGRPLTRLAETVGAATAIAFSADSERLAAAVSVVGLGVSSEVRVENITTGKLERVIHVTGPVHTLAFSPSGNQLALGSSSGFFMHSRAGYLKLFDLASGTETASIEPHVGKVSQLSYAASGRGLLVGGTNGICRLFDLQGKPIDAPVFQPLHAPDASIRSAGYFADDSFIFAADESGPLKVWDAGTYKQVAGMFPEVAAWPPHGGFLSAPVAFSKDGSVAAVGWVDTERPLQTNLKLFERADRE